ncbi:MAG: hypothetical protein CMH54_04545 [Myxococcales bacterium]|nr:hypothetical protein [Myxococcales bacterium]|tara:strand:+ start:957 stop:1418 length:462 start_codon:yes stop_codon:yes gene_type:complete
MNFRKNNSRRRKNLPGIDITALVDVVFLLLIFLVVTTQFKDQRKMDRYAISVPLPRAGQHAVVTEKGVPVIVVDGDGQLIWADPDTAEPRGQVVEETDLVRLLEEFAVRHPQGAIRLQAAKETAYQKVIDVIDQAKRAKVHEVKLETQPLAVP